MAHGTSHGHSNGRLGDGTLAGQDFEEGLGHTLPLSTLRNVLLTLLVLTVITVAASRVDFGQWNVIIAIAIATVKAGIVATYFMHLKFEGPTILMYVFYPIVLIFLFVGSNVSDIASREHVRPSTVPIDLPVPKVVGPHGEVPATGHGAPAAEHAPGAH